MSTGSAQCRCKGYGCVTCLAGHPPGKTCSDCVHFKRTCIWLLSYDGTETSCDWIPSRFVERKAAAQEAVSSS
jgi:hypothetical protein